MSNKPEWQIAQGDNLTILKDLDDEVFHSIVTDSPYGIEWMNHKWDYDVPQPEFWAEALRVAMPGAWLVSFGGSRTYHRMAAAIEDGGWELRDMLLWLYGTGMAHGHNIHELGEGTCLKPSYEGIVLARKPFKGTVEACRAKYGTATLSIDACKLDNPTGSGPRSASEPSAQRRYQDEGVTDFAHTPGPRGGSEDGRWPPNLCIDESVAEDMGAACRTFYCSKASTKEKEAGVLREPQAVGDGRKKANDTAYQRGKKMRRNIHSTVKPINLMRWLVRLVSRPGQLLLDPFVGSGTTAIAAVLEGRSILGLDENADYVEIAQQRVAHWESQA